MSRCLFSLTLLLIIALSPCVAAEELKLEVIEPRHRPAEELLPVLQPLVGPDGSVSAFQGKLVVKATPDSLREVHELLRSLDVPARQLLVSVTQDTDLVEQERSVGLEGSVQAGNVELGFPSDSAWRPDVTVGGEDARIGIGTRSSTTRRSDVQQLKVLDGREAVIHVGQSIPVVTRTTTYGGLPSIQETVEYRDVLVGFVVLPRVTGDQVTLQIQPRQDVLTQQPGVVNLQRISSTVSGRLGAWISLGEITQQQTGQSRDLASSHNFDQTEQRGIWLKVQEVR